MRCSLPFICFLLVSSENVQPCQVGERLGVARRLLRRLYIRPSLDAALAPAPTNQAAPCLTGAECHVTQNYAALALTSPPLPTRPV